MAMAARVCPALMAGEKGFVSSRNCSSFGSFRPGIRVLSAKGRYLIVLQ